MAVATPPGRGAVALVRLSGPEAKTILQAIAPEVEEPAPRRSIRAVVRDPETDQMLDQALVVWFRAPASYTGEDVVEVSTHGGVMAPALVRDACVRCGAREAEPGEFTQRAYLNGKLDLVQAEAVADVVDGGSRAMHQAALHQLEEGLSRRLEAVREELVGVEAALVHHVDFPEEDDAPASPEEVAARADGLAARLRTLVDTAPEGEMLREGALTVLAGRPNAGKSSLFNALLGEERAIVTDHPGTTRDAVEAVVSLGGYPFRLVDTAGFRQAGEEVERLGIEVAGRYVERAQVILLCVDARVGWGEAEERFVREAGTGGAGPPVVVLWTKSDEPGGPQPSLPGGDGIAPGEARTPVVAFPVSVRTGRGLARVREELPGLLFRGLVAGGGEMPVLTRRRQVREARRALEEVEAFAVGIREGMPAEVAGTHLRDGEAALEALLGVVPPEEILDQVFSEFCIGK